jgi:SAM-dependent methyltransferase
MRVLFVMPNPGYFRIYGSTVRLLAERGHDVLLSYDNSEKLTSEVATEVEQDERVTVVEAAPWRTGKWEPFVWNLRLGGDYARYMAPRFADAEGLRRRMDKFLPEKLAFLRRWTLTGRQSRILRAVLRALERAVPSDPGVDRFIQEHRPDCVLVTPLLLRGKGGIRQADVVKSARAQGIPVAVAVASWDHLSSKGMLRCDPDRVFVWNDAQKGEATSLHDIPAANVVVTGAQLFDQWFERRPTVDAGAFHESVGLAGSDPYILFVGSSPNIAPPDREVEFFRRWLAALRESSSPVLREIPVLVRPHPGNYGQWQRADLSGAGNVAISPKARPSLPMNEDDEAHYFHSLHHALAAVGVNTSAMVEAAAVGRAVFTVRVPEFQDTQEGTLHFRLLVPEDGAGIRAADDLAEHLEQLAEAAANPAALEAETRAFAESFIRPNGLGRPATPILVDAIEALAILPHRPARSTLPTKALRWFARRLIVGRPRRSQPAGQGRPQEPPVVDRPSATAEGREIVTSLEDFVHPARPFAITRRLLRTRWKAAKGLVQSAFRPRDRSQGAVSDIYEGHYASTNTDYALSRDRRRDLFVADGRTVQADGWYTIRFHLDELMRSLDGLAVRSVLEVGSGRGTNLAMLGMRRPELDLTGIELTSNGVERARELVADPTPQHVRAAGLSHLTGDGRAALARARFVCASAMQMPFEDKSFDLSFTCLVLEQIPQDFPAILAEMRRVTRGYCVFLEPFSDANGLLGRAYLRSLDYFRAPHGSFAEHGLEPVAFRTELPQKVRFRTGLLVARVR